MSSGQNVAYCNSSNTCGGCVASAGCGWCSSEENCLNGVELGASDTTSQCANGIGGWHWFSCDKYNVTCKLQPVHAQSALAALTSMTVSSLMNTIEAVAQLVQQDLSRNLIAQLSTVSVQLLPTPATPAPTPAPAPTPIDKLPSGSDWFWNDWSWTHKEFSFEMMSGIAVTSMFCGALFGACCCRKSKPHDVVDSEFAEEPLVNQPSPRLSAYQHPTPATNAAHVNESTQPRASAPPLYSLQGRSSYMPYRNDQHQSNS